MVKSNIDNDVNYNESKGIEDEDIGYSSPLYDFKLFNIEIEIAIGKQKHTYSNHKIVYFPIYLIIDNYLVSKIGVYEISQLELINYLDEDGDIKLRKKGLLFYISKDYLQEQIEEYKTENDETIKDKEKEQEAVKILDSDLNDTNDKKEEDDDDIANLKIPENKLSKTTEKSNEKLKDGIFEEKESINIPKLQEETKEQSEQIKKEYQESSRNNWLVKFRKNNNYKIIDNEGGGDCFFATIRDAFKQVGKETTVEKLRALLAKEANKELFDEIRTLYVGILAESQQQEKEMKDIKKTVEKIKERIKKIKNPVEEKELVESVKDMALKYEKIKENKKSTVEMLNEFKYMEGITNLEQLREFMMTSQYWADTWSISTLERLLNIKVIVLSKQSFESGDVDSVMNCGQLNDEELQKKQIFQPDFYIMTSYTGNHYTLVSYKEKRIFQFEEIPYDIKIMIISKCLEKNSGPYYLIKDFRNFKLKLGLDEDEGEQKENEDEYLNSDLYNNKTVLVFYEKSSSTPKAGRGNGEKTDNLIKYNTLNSIKDWRRMLDDNWTMPITIDNKRWNSVSHYYLSSQFKKGFPDYYTLYSLDSGSNISKDVKEARDEYNKVIKTKKSTLKDGNITPDPDFFSIKDKPINEIERNLALEAKFTQNLNLKQALLETKDAKLCHFQRGKESDPDILLMKLRKQLREPTKN
jgi:hypothetical protein